MKKEIRELVEYALFDIENKNKALEIGIVNKKQSEVIKENTGIETYGCKRFLDTSAIKHILRKHGSIKTEEKRGQIAINIDDFENIPTYIANADLIEYVGKNLLQQDVFKYTSQQNGLIIIIESVVINKRGNKIYIETMYKKKKSNDNKL
jgi:phage-Barnase-EndoU-ColicinE5/D-RelE like nuclease3